MAPNRKNLSGLLSALSSSDLETLQQSVQPAAKFLPLTHPVEQAKPQTPPPATTTKPQQNENSASYWEWTSEDVVEEAEPVDLFSASRLEANLIKDASTSSTESGSESHLVSDHDDYWAEADQQQTEVAEPASSAPQHVVESASYWDWTSEKEESQSYWEWESPKVAPHVVNPVAYPSKANYWDWDTQETVNAVLESEAAREFLMAANIVKQLQAAAPVSSSGTNASSDEYWTASEHYGDEYWTAPATPVAVAATGGYWDM